MPYIVYKYHHGELAHTAREIYEQVVIAILPGESYRQARAFARVLTRLPLGEFYAVEFEKADDVMRAVAVVKTKELHQRMQVPTLS